jgi:hypothetical protein
VGRDFLHMSIPVPEPTYPPIQWVPGLFPRDVALTTPRPSSSDVKESPLGLHDLFSAKLQRLPYQVSLSGKINADGSSLLVQVRNILRGLTFRRWSRIVLCSGLCMCSPGKKIPKFR